MKTETITVTVSKQFTKNLRQVAYYFAKEDDLGYVLEDQSKHVFEQLLDKDCNYCELADDIQDCGFQDSARANTIGARLAKKIHRETLVRYCHARKAWEVIVIPATAA